MSDGTIEEIDTERKYQVEKGFTKEHDNDKMPHEWVDLTYMYIDKAEKAQTPESYRAMLVKVAAIAIAAVEAYDRTE